MAANSEIIYLDHAATTPLNPVVAAAMMPWIIGDLGYGNPSSVHKLGRSAREALDNARDAVAALLQCRYSEVTFTSGGTEADNLAIFGAVGAAEPNRNRIVTTTIEHHAVLHAVHRLEMQGYEVELVQVDSDGVVRADDIDRAITSRTALVSVMHANNEIGTIQPIERVAHLAHERGALFHTDAVQTAGVMPLRVDDIDCDLLTISAHKIYGPKGAGALYVRSGTPLSPMLVGGAQERERRAGTENVAGLVGFGAAAALAQARITADSERLVELRDRFIQQLFELTSGLSLNGHAVARLPGNVNISISGVDGSTLLMNLDRFGVCASSGAACSSGSIEPSHVLKAIGLPPDRASGGVRFSLGRDTTEAELARTAVIVSDIAKRLQSRSNVC